MYRPEHFAVAWPQVAALVAEHPLCVLISAAPDGQAFVSLCPLVAESAADGAAAPLRLWGHVARANPHHALWHEGGAADGTGASVTVLVLGPSAYISPNWYVPAGQARAVPTWNYAAAQLRGRLQVVDDEAGKDRLLKRLIAHMEPGYAAQWRALPHDFQSRMLAAIVGFRIEVDEVLGKFKLSQNRSAADRQAVASALAAADDPQAHAVAGWMRRLGVAE